MLGEKSRPGLLIKKLPKTSMEGGMGGAGNATRRLSKAPLSTVKSLLGCKPTRYFCFVILLERAKYSSDSTFQFAQQAGEGQGFREARRASSGILKSKHFPQTGPCLMEGRSPAKPETAPAASGEGWDASVQSPSQLIPLSSPTWVLTLQDPLPLARGMRPCPVDAS